MTDAGAEKLTAAIASVVGRGVVPDRLQLSTATATEFAIHATEIAHDGYVLAVAYNEEVPAGKFRVSGETRAVTSEDA